MRIYVGGERDEWASVEVAVEPGDQPWVESAEGGSHVILGVAAEPRFGDERVRLMFPSVEALRTWLVSAIHAASLEAWVLEAPER